ncbi:MAG TPA: hypothetical protein PK752_12910 [Accumulibacter sp.]|uniref:hypothetical protein n=1 Tax=Accumulibacter sp. TaxID=2053492 RepID=UPI002C2593D6|nr:hypothetical protein [Accumulibacter sp.]HRD89134.1 hypothetical protein [Accumulibacter sp.]
MSLRVDDSAGPQVDQWSEDVGSPGEQGASQYAGFDPLPRRMGLCLAIRPRLVEAAAWNVEAMLGVIEQAPGACFDQRFLPLQRIGWDRTGLDPVALVEHTLFIGAVSER